MEVCGTHTVSLFRSGIRGVLPASIRLVSGPGCPVCVTPAESIEKALFLATRKNTILFCFGDMLKVPSGGRSLESARAHDNAAVQLMYSPQEALDFARRHPAMDVVLFGVGFETTIPLFAAVLRRTLEQEINNIYLLCSFKTIPPALEALLSSADASIDGFILPGHVSVIIGEKSYGFMADRYGVPAVITGFEPVDMLAGIWLLVDMIEKNEAAVKNQYCRVVSFEGNRKAQEVMRSVFVPCDSEWRGLGSIPLSGLRLNDTYARFDAETLIDSKIAAVQDPKGCMCSQVIKGKMLPDECGLFKKICTPATPVGPCMVSSEGTCAAFYKYGG